MHKMFGILTSYGQSLDFLSPIDHTLQNWHFRFGNVTCLGRNHFINNSIIDSFFCRHEEITIAIGFNLVLGLIAVFCNVRIEDFTNKQNFLGLNFNIGSLSLCSSQAVDES